MTREEAIEVLKNTLPYTSEFADARAVAIKSLEAWDKVFHEANERYFTFIPSNFEEGETYEGAFHDGMGYVMDVINKHLKEVEDVR